MGPRCGAAGAELARLAAAAGGVLLPGHGSIPACRWAWWPCFSWVHPGNGCFACSISLRFGLGFFAVHLGVSSRFEWRKAAQGLAEAFQH